MQKPYSNNTKNFTWSAVYTDDATDATIKWHEVTDRQEHHKSYYLRLYVHKYVRQFHNLKMHAVCCPTAISCFFFCCADVAPAVALLYCCSVNVHDKDLAPSRENFLGDRRVLREQKKFFFVAVCGLFCQLKVKVSKCFVTKLNFSEKLEQTKRQVLWE